MSSSAVGVVTMEVKPKIGLDAIERPQRQRLSLLVKGADGSGHVLNDLCASLWFTYLLLYLQSVVKLNSDLAAGLLLLGQVRKIQFIVSARIATVRLDTKVIQ